MSVFVWYEPWNTHHKLVKYLSSGGVVVSTYCYRYSDAGSVPTPATDELQIERNSSGDWERSVLQTFKHKNNMKITDFAISYMGPDSWNKILDISAQTIDSSSVFS